VSREYPFEHLVPCAIFSVPLFGFFFFTHKLTEVWAIAAFAVSAMVAMPASANRKIKRPLREVITSFLPVNESS
jgi:hypothetical protein